MRATTALIRTEFRFLGRSPAVLIWAVAIPVTALVVMAAIPAARRRVEGFGDLSVLEMYQPTVIVFALTMLALQMLPPTIGQYRELGFLRRLRTTPASPWQLLAAVLVVLFCSSMVVGVVLLVIPLLVGVGRYGALPALLLLLAATSACYLGLGALLAAVIPNAKVAGGVGATVAMVLWFLAGMWVPRAFFPGWLAQIAAWSPGVSATALTEAALGHGVDVRALTVLLCWAVIAFAVAVRTFRWE